MSLSKRDFFIKLFDNLSSGSVEYAVMRGYCSLPEDVDGDVDVLVSEGCRESCIDLFLKTVRESGSHIIGKSYSSEFLKFFVIGREGKCGDWWGVCFDFNFGLRYKGIKYVDDSFNISKKRYNGVMVLDDGPSAILGLIKELLNNDLVSQRYYSESRRFVLNNRRCVKEMFSPMGGRCLDKLFDLMESERNCLKTSGISRCFLRYSLLNNPIGYFKLRLQHFSSKVLRYISPAGRVFAFLGVDGAGKSTVIDSILPILNESTHNNVIVRHLRPTILPPLSQYKRIFKKNAPVVGVVDRPHDAPLSGFFPSFVRLFYLCLDYIFGYWLFTRKKISQKPTIFLYDRYAYDLLLDPRRLRVGFPKWGVRLVLRLLPRPDLVFLLHGDPDIIVNRKNELPLEEVRRQVSEIRNLHYDESIRSLMINTTSRGINEVRDEVIEAIIETYK